MANSNSAAKRNRQNERRRLGNKTVKTRVRSSIKDFLTAVDKKDQVKAESLLKSAEGLLDAAARKGLYHKNTAARTKSRLHKRLKALSVE